MSELESEIKKQEEIKQKDTVEVKKDETVWKNEPFLGDQIEAPAQKKTMRSKSFDSNLKVKELIEIASFLPHHIPEKKADPKEEILTKMQELHHVLDQEEEAFLKKSKKKGAREVNRTRYADISEAKRNKRVNNAIKRQEAAAKIVEVENLRTNAVFEQFDIDRERFEKEIRGFMMITNEPFRMHDDESFAHNLQKNYELYEYASRMKKWVEDAVDGGYFPKDISLRKTEAKISRFFEMKEYLDIRKDLMKNPYYQYMAKEDVSYNDDQIRILINKTGNKTLKNYLTLVQKLRALSYVRKEGLQKSLRESSQKEGKRQTELLRTREEKRQLLRTFSEEALEIQGNKRFRDRDYDSRFTPEVFEEALNYFNKIEVKDLHFKSLKDIAEHFKENTRLFDETREFEHLLFVAVQRGQAPADAEMIRLRAKIKAFKSAEYMMNLMQYRLLRDPKRYLGQRTYEEFFEECRDDVKGLEPGGGYPVPVPGMNMDSYYQSILKMLQREYNNRGKEIKIAYGTFHCEREGDDFRLGEISRDELQSRKRDYEKNAFTNDYIVDLNRYIANGYNQRAMCFALVYGKRKGKPVRSVNGRMMTMYTAGMSGEELKAFIDVMDFGTEEEKAALTLKLTDEIKSQNLTELATWDPKLFMHNMAYKTRMFGILANLEYPEKELSGSIKEDELIKEIRLVSNLGTGHASRYGAYPVTLKGRWWRSLSLQDWFSVEDPDKLVEFSDWCFQNKEANGELRLGNQLITEDEKETALFTNHLKRPWMDINNEISQYNKERARNGRRNTAAIQIYETRKHLGLSKDTTKEEQKRVRTFYEENYKPKPVEDLAGKEAQEKIYAIEDAFLKIMSFDLSLFTYKSYKDIADAAGKDRKRFLECVGISRLAEKASEYAGDYRVFMEDALPGTYQFRLKEEDLKEIRARAAVIVQGGALFGDTFFDILKSPALEKSPLSLDEILHLSEEEINELKNAAAPGEAGNEERKFWDDVLTVTRQLNGFDLNLNLKDFIGTKRFEMECTGEQREKQILAALHKKSGGNVLGVCVHPESVLNHESAEEFLGRFAEAFHEREVDVSERERRMDATADPLYKKRKNAETLKKERDKSINYRIRLRRQVTTKLRRAVGDEDLVHLSTFLTGERKNGKLLLGGNDKDLLKLYADKETRFSALDRVTRDFFLESYDLDLNSDEEFAAQTTRMERLSAMTLAYAALLKANPDYLDRLRLSVDKNGESDYAKTMNVLDKNLAISDYYRARCLLITDSHYISHYDDEMSANHDENCSEDQRYIADLIRLTAQCAGRVDGQKLLSRTDADLDAVLGSLEEKSRRRPYLYGKADLKKADVSQAAKADREFQDYMYKVLEVRKLFPADREIENTIRDSEGSPFPEARHLETEAVRNRLDMIRRTKKLQHGGLGAEIQKYDEKRQQLYAQLKPIMEQIKRFELRDPKGREVLSLNTNPDRHFNMIFYNMGLEVPNEEILEIFEGFVIAQNMKVKTPEDFAYAKKRWLNSAKKMFYLEYNAVKRMESTYGSLPDQLPIGCFMNAVGASEPLIYTRWNFGQDALEMTELKDCVVGGEKMSLGSLLAKEGLVKEDDFSDFLHLNRGFYNHLGDYYMNYCQNGTMVFDADQEIFENSDISRGYDVSVVVTETQSRQKLKGPSLSAGEERKIWQDAFREGTPLMYGTGESVLFVKEKLNLYSAAELREIRQRRKNEYELIRLYEGAARGRIRQLQSQVVNEMKGMNIAVDDALEELIGKLVPFHPAMMTDIAIEKIPKKEISAFITLVKDFAGIGVLEEAKAVKKFGAYQKLEKQMSVIAQSGELYVKHTQEITGDDSLIDEQTYQNRNTKIDFQSRLMRLTVVEQMSDTLQNFMKEEEDKSVIGQVTYKRFCEIRKEVLPGSIIKALKLSSPYRRLKDIGNRRDSVPACELAEVKYMLAHMGNRNLNDMDGDFPSAEQRALLKKLYGIEFLKTSEILGTKEESEKEDKKPEKKEKKSAESKEPQLQVIQNMDPNIPIGPELTAGTKIYIDERSPEVLETLANKNKVYTTEEYRDEDKAGYEQILLTNGHKIPKGLEDLTKRRSPYMEQKYYYIEENGQRRETSDYFWKKSVKEELKGAYAWLVGYYRARHDMIPEPPHVEYDPNQMAPENGPHIPYESQGVNTLYCWACCLSGMMNAYAPKKVASLDDIRFTNMPIPKYEDSGFTNRAQYDAGKTLIERMMRGEETGNPSIFGDYVLRKLPNTAVRSAHIGAAGGNLALGKRRFLEILGTQLRNGPVGVLYQNHFVLVYGINGDNLLVRDSNEHGAPDALHPYRYTAATMFKDKGSEVELVWLENLVGKEEQVAQEFQLHYDQEKGEFSGGTETKVKERILHRDGIEEAYVSEEDQLVSHSIYLPKQMNREAAQ